MDVSGDGAGRFAAGVGVGWERWFVGVATFRGRVDERLSAQELELEQQVLESAQEAVGEAKTWQPVELSALAWLSSLTGVSWSFLELR